MSLLEVRNLQVKAEDKLILRGVDLEVNPGEVHAIMGPNGSGKSTLARALAGHPGYEVVAGEVRYDGQDLLEMDPDERAREGLFMAFQYPVEIPGVNNAYFLKAALNARRKHQGLDELDAIDFMAFMKERAKLLQVDESMLQRSVTEGFSGGEK
jgi:Fe-S cluster assembly ATP-binding protein